MAEQPPEEQIPKATAEAAPTATGAGAIAAPDGGNQAGQPASAQPVTSQVAYLSPLQ